MHARSKTPSSFSVVAKISVFATLALSNAVMALAIPSNQIDTPILSAPNHLPSSEGRESFSGTFVIRLLGTTGHITGNDRNAYEQSCTKFFQENLSDGTAAVETRLLGQNRSRRRMLRNLQGEDDQILNTQVYVSAVSFKGNFEKFEQSLPKIVNNNATGLLKLLTRDEETADTARAFFRSVQAVEAYKYNEAKTAIERRLDDEDSDDDDDVPQWFIIAIVAGALIGLALVIGGALCFCRPHCRRINPDDSSRKEAPRSSAKHKSGAKKKRQSAQKTLKAPPPPVPSSLSFGRRASSGESTAPSLYGNTDVQSVEPTEYTLEQKFRPSAGTVTNDIITVAGSEYGGDAMSFAYSLSPGNFDQESVAVTNVQDTAAAKKSASRRQNMVKRTVTAPPGKLGLTMETTAEGPAVHMVRERSPMEGLLFPGDIIISVNGVDTRAMSSSALTALLTRSGQRQRKLTVLSEDIAI